MREKIIDLLYAENVRSDCGIERLADEICAIDAVEVVRCKDCVHYGNDCVLLFPADGYCYDGERREE